VKHLMRSRARHSPNSKTRIDGHDRESRPKRHMGDPDESTLFFDDSKMPLEVMDVPIPEAAGLAEDEYEVISEKVSHHLAQRPGSYVVLKYVRQVIKRLDTQSLSCHAAPVGIIEGISGRMSVSSPA